MSYLTVITLDTAKIHLRVDDNASDNEITRMIKSACRYIENYTNVMLYKREKVYNVTNKCVRVYDAPIVQPTGVTKEIKGTYTLYSEIETDTLTLEVGYPFSTQVPSDLIDAALAMVDVWFFGAEKQVDTTLIPQDVKLTLDMYKRFLI